MNLMKFLGFNFLLLCYACGLFPQKALILEIDNVLFTIDESETLGSFSSSLGKWAIEHYRDNFFKILSKIEINSISSTFGFFQNLTYCQKPLPSLFALYYLGIINSKQAYGEAIKAIHSQTSFFDPSRYAYLKAAETSFSPIKEVELMKPNMHIFELIQMCRNKNIWIVVLSNKNRESLDKLREVHTGFFEYFDHVMISNDLKNLKPNSDIYIKIAQDLGIDIHNSFVIESQENYTQKACEAGYNSITYRPNKEEELFEFLTKNKFI